MLEAVNHHIEEVEQWDTLEESLNSSVPAQPSPYWSDMFWATSESSSGHSNSEEWKHPREYGEYANPEPLHVKEDPFDAVVDYERQDDT